MASRFFEREPRRSQGFPGERPGFTFQTNFDWSSVQSKQKTGTDITNDFVKSVLESLGRGLLDPRYSDFTVVVGDQSFPCHRIILSGCSKFFEAILRSDIRGGTILGMSPQTFRLVLNVLYKGDNVLTQDNMIDIWNAANHLQIEFLVKYCEKFVIESISPRNFGEVHTNAMKLNSQRVEQAAINFMSKEINLVRQSQYFLGLSVKDLLRLLSCEVEHPDHGAFSLPLSGRRDVIVESILTWLSGDSDQEPNEGRLAHLPTLLTTADLQRVSDGCLQKLMTSDPVLSCKRAVAMVNEEASRRLGKRSDSGYKCTMLARR